MKRFAIFFSFVIFFLSQGFSNVGFSFGFGSGFRSYKGFAKNRKSEFDFNHRICFFSDAEFQKFIKNRASIFLAADIFSDFCFGSGHYNILDWNLIFGFDFYTGLGGLIFRAAYTFGRRSDFLDFENSGKKIDLIKKSAFGNGFKLSSEWEFFYNEKKRGFFPVIGISWGFFPRGSGIYDNSFMIYTKLRKKNRGRDG